MADGIKVEGPGRQRLVMFQESALFPWLDCLGNVMFGLKLDDESRRSGAARDRRIDISSLVGLEQVRQRPTCTSSPAACGSAWRWRGRSRPIRGCC